MKTAEKKKENVTPFDVADYLDSDEMIAGYLVEMLEENDPRLFLKAVGHAMRAKGVAEIAEKTGLAREGLYRAFQPGRKPQFETVWKVLAALGVRFGVVQPKSTRKPRRTIKATGTRGRKTAKGRKRQPVAV